MIALSRWLWLLVPVGILAAWGVWNEIRAKKGKPAPEEKPEGVDRGW